MTDITDTTNMRTGLSLREICAILDGEIACCEERSGQVVTAGCGCDLMSDVLAFSKPGSVLLTGLTNSQVVRTAEMLDMKAIVFVRSKRPDGHTVQMAESLGIMLILTDKPLYESCGLLYRAGLSGGLARAGGLQAESA